MTERTYFCMCWTQERYWKRKANTGGLVSRGSVMWWQRWWWWEIPDFYMRCLENVITSFALAVGVADPRRLQSLGKPYGTQRSRFLCSFTFFHDSNGI